MDILLTLKIKPRNSKYVVLDLEIIHSGGTHPLEITLYKYFTIKDKLPNPNSPLFASILYSSIVAINAQVRKSLMISENKLA